MSWADGGPGSTLSAQARYAAGTREILQRAGWTAPPIRDEYLIVAGGGRRRLAGTGVRSYSARS